MRKILGFVLLFVVASAAAAIYVKRNQVTVPKDVNEIHRSEKDKVEIKAPTNASISIAVIEPKAKH